jgi:hypothetical protein
MWGTRQCELREFAAGLQRANRFSRYFISGRHRTNGAGNIAHRRMPPMSDATTKTFWGTRNILILVVIFGVPILLGLGAGYGVLSPREWAFGMIAWVAMLLLLASARKRAAKKKPTAGVEQGSAIDDAGRKRMLRDIRKRKVWIAVLIVLLPIGIANGVAHRAWLPTLTGVGISLTLMYVAIREIRQRRKRLGQVPQV